MEMALLLKKPKNAWVENAKIAWERIFENECDDLKGCCAVRILYSMVKKHCKNGEESYVIQISDLIQIAESRKKKITNRLFCVLDHFKIQALYQLQLSATAWCC